MTRSKDHKLAIAMSRRSAVLTVAAIVAAMLIAAAPALADGGKGGGGGGSSGSGSGGSGSGGSGSGGNSGSGSGNSGSGGDDGGDDAGNSGKGGGDSGKSNARDAIRRGEAQPVNRIIASARQAHPGEVLALNLRKSGSSLVYDVKLLDKAGNVVVVRVDARTAVALAVRGG